MVDYSDIFRNNNKYEILINKKCRYKRIIGGTKQRETKSFIDFL